MDTDSWFSPPLRWPPTAWYRTTERSESHARPIWSRTPDVQPAKACVPRLAQTWSLSQKITLIWMIKIMNSLRTYFFFRESLSDSSGQASEWLPSWIGSCKLLTAKSSNELAGGANPSEKVVVNDDHPIPMVFQNVENRKLLETTYHLF